MTLLCATPINEPGKHELSSTVAGVGLLDDMGAEAINRDTERRAYLIQPNGPDYSIPFLLLPATMQVIDEFWDQISEQELRLEAAPHRAPLLVPEYWGITVYIHRLPAAISLSRERGIEVRSKPLTELAAQEVFGRLVNFDALIAANLIWLSRWNQGVDLDLTLIEAEQRKLSNDPRFLGPTRRAITDWQEVASFLRAHDEILREIDLSQGADAALVYKALREVGAPPRYRTFTTKRFLRTETVVCAEWVTGWEQVTSETSGETTVGAKLVDGHLPDSIAAGLSWVSGDKLIGLRQWVGQRERDGNS